MTKKKVKLKRKNRSCSTSKKDSEQTILCKYKIRLIDCVRALSSLLVFLVFATSSSDVQSCFFPHATANGNALMMNLMLAAQLEATVSFLFMLSPTRRRRIGFACKIAEGLALRIIVGCGLAFKIAAGESLVSDPRVGAGLRRDQTRVDGSSTRPVPVLGRGLAVGGEGIAGSLAEFLVVGRRRDAVSAVLVTGGAKMNGGA
ncbi:hypothetical protein LWI28_004178 [Acer negundo]|uniref:Uncharacterized protein n=1 Tax=Acer negundo TaxID=4023 RepID=A0AAD5NWE7_ACENE|nr:hypothetical protein LWI28_004178 [Acer negundo]